jgi:hypothetical protein
MGPPRPIRPGATSAILPKSSLHVYAKPPVSCLPFFRVIFQGNRAPFLVSLSFAHCRSSVSCVAVPTSSKVTPARQNKSSARGTKRQGTNVVTKTRTFSSPSSSTSSSPGPESSALLTHTTLVIGRPKTSHTTIERRYRTNLNTRIQSLRLAVPALRVLDEKNQAENGSEDIVDERGFVDGVKVARKVSKANVLGKAVEYIRWVMFHRLED